MNAFIKKTGEQIFILEGMTCDEKYMVAMRRLPHRSRRGYLAEVITIKRDNVRFA